MNSLRKTSIYKILILLVALILSFLSTFMIYEVLENILFEKLSIALGVVGENSKDLEVEIMKQLKSNNLQYIAEGKELLEKYGYFQDTIIFLNNKQKIITVAMVFCLLITLLIYINTTIHNRNKKKNINKLTNYLKNINHGDYSLDISIDKDYELLSDELYKTIVSLRELKENAVKDRINLKDNLSDISHQLKTPITSINIMAELMENTNTKEDSEEYILRLKKQLERLETLTNTLLTISKLDAGTIELKKEEVDIENIINLAIEPILFLVDKKNISINIKGDNATITGDLYWLSEAFLNIIKNSTEHLPENGTIHIYINSNPIFTEILIEDNGYGFCKEDIPFLFKRFFKGKNSKKESIGIGLSMAKSIIEKHNGEIQAENKIGGGARFRIKFY